MKNIKIIGVVVLAAVVLLGAYFAGKKDAAKESMITSTPTAQEKEQIKKFFGEKQREMRKM